MSLPKVTYLLENASDSDCTVLGYYNRLCDAKAEARRHPRAYITKLQGQHFGEGFHVYKLEWYNGFRYYPLR